MKKADPKGEGPNRRGGAAIIAAAASLLCGVGTANAQDLEPRAYAASPIGTNFLVSGLGTRVAPCRRPISANHGRQGGNR